MSSYNNQTAINDDVSKQLNMEQKPLGNNFKSYELTKATNYWVLDPYQYSITKFDYNLPNGVTNKHKDEFSPGLNYKDVNFESLHSNETSNKKSVNDFPAQSYHRFEANDGYFNPNENKDKDLWYYGSDRIAQEKGAGGPALNVQEVNRIIFPEAQRGGTNSRTLTKYSWSNTTPKKSEAWESASGLYKPVDNNENGKNFSYNNGYFVDKNTQPFERIYSYDSNYFRNVGLNNPYEGSMPFNPQTIN